MLTYKEYINEEVSYEEYLEVLNGDFNLVQEAVVSAKIQDLAKYFSEVGSFSLSEVIKILTDRLVYNFLKMFKFSIKEIEKGFQEGYKAAKIILKEIGKGTNITLEWIEAHPVITGMATKILIYALLYFWLSGVVIPDILNIISGSKEIVAESVSAATFEVGNTGITLLKPGGVQAFLISAFFQLKNL